MCAGSGDDGEGSASDEESDAALFSDDGSPTRRRDRSAAGSLATLGEHDLVYASVEMLLMLGGRSARAPTRVIEYTILVRAR